MAKHHLDKILSALGEEQIQARTGMSDRAIEHAKYVGYFSGLWFGPIEKMCIEVGAACPREAFNWKQSPKKVGSAAPQVQPSPQKSAEGAV